MSKVIMLIGIPGCGKTTFCKKFLPELTRISRDELGSTKKEHNVIEDSLMNNRDFVIDDINPTLQSRATLIDMIKKYDDAEITGIFFKFGVDRCLSQNSKRKKSLPDVVIYKWNKELESPSNDEGFDNLQILDNEFQF